MSASRPLAIALQTAIAALALAAWRCSNALPARIRTAAQALFGITRCTTSLTACPGLAACPG